jgi:hypothetical protein
MDANRLDTIRENVLGNDSSIVPCQREETLAAIEHIRSQSTAVGERLKDVRYDKIEDLHQGFLNAPPNKIVYAQKLDLLLIFNALDRFEDALNSPAPEPAPNPEA